jgi:glycosyltransferase involved in cell wall biosynthesis
MAGAEQPPSADAPRVAGPAGSIGAVHQFVPSFARHDAIGNHVVQLRRLLREAGFASEIFYEHIDPALTGEARAYRECPAGADAGRLILYHASTHSGMNDWLIDAARSGQAVAVDYHNITPARYFSAWEPRAARSMELARAQLAELAPYLGTAVADSQYNATELEEFGVRGAVACPILLDLDDYHRAPDPAVLDRLCSRAADGPLWLFVGRVAPNKCQHDVIAAFSVYHRLHAPGSRLALVGGVTSGRYQHSLERLAAGLGVDGAVDFVGSAPFPELLAYFAAADVFVCLSEHEGFCVPVIEAMELGVPVVAYSAAAVTETVAHAGLLLDDKDPLAVAEAVHHLLDDPDLRRETVAAGRARAGEFSFAATSARWRAEMERITTRSTRALG